jgi:hypothetical protein
MPRLLPLRGRFTIRRFFVLGCIAAAFGGQPSNALADVLAIRPHVGLGYGSEPGGESSGRVLHAGGRVLLSASASKSYGIEATYLQVPAKGTHAEYLAVGIVLEQRLWHWFNMSIGTIGYVGLATGTGNPFGIVTNLGWEPDWGRFSPFVTYRSEWIFRSPVVTVNSASAGATARF